MLHAEDEDVVALSLVYPQERGLVLLALRHGFVPPGAHCEQPDPTLRAHYQREARDARLAVAASNSFGFGGSNSCLLFGVAR